MIIREMQIIGAYPLICILISMVHLCVGVFMVLKNPRDRTNQVFFLAIISLVFWILLHSINMALWEFPDVLITTAKLAYAGGMLTAGTVAVFCVIFANKGVLPRRVVAFISAVCGFFIFTAFVPGAILKDFRVTEAGPMRIPGPLETPFYVTEAALFTYGLWHLWRCYRTTAFEEEKFRMRLLGIGIFIPVLVSLSTLGVLPHFMPTSRFLSAMGPISSITFIALAAYALSKHGYWIEMDFALEYLFNSLSAGICVTQIDGRIIRHNDRLLEILDHEGSLAGESIDDLINLFESKAERTNSFPRQWFKEDESKSIEIALENPMNQTLELTADKLVNNKGKVLGKVFQFNDISDRKRADAALEESLSLVNATLQSTADGIIVVDTAGKVQNYNQRFLELWRISDDYLKSNDDNQGRVHALNQIKDPGRIIKETEELFENPDLEHFSVLELTDGRTLERYSRPQKVNGETVGIVISFRDVTERKKAEEALRESEDRYRTLVDNSLAAICLLQDFVIRFANKKFEEMSGYAPEELIDMPVLDLIYVDDREIFLKAAAERIRGKDPGKHYQYRVVNKNGEVLWVEVFGKVVEHRGKPAILASLVDITHRKLAEEALRESEERYRMVFEEARDIICTIDIATGMVTSANSYAEQVLGYRLHDVINKETFLALLHPDDHEMLVERLHELAFEKTRKPNLAFRLRRADGTYIEAEINGSVIYDAQGNPQTLIGVIRDITERKRVEQALRESERKYRTLFEESKDSIFVSTPEGRFLDINRAGAEMYGYSKKELLELDPARDLFADLGGREAFKRKIEQNGYVKDHEGVYRRKDGRIITVLETVTALRDENGNIVAYRGIQRDVTEQKHLQQQLLQAQKMESLGTLAGGIAHDFNNLLGGILGYASVMKSKMTDDHPFFKYVNTIERTSERAAQLTAQLLGFARGGKYHSATTDINVIVHETLKIIDRTIDKSIQIESHLSKEQLMVEADASQLQQVLLNLCVNASDAMPGGGRLIIVTDSILLDEEPAGVHMDIEAGRYVVLSVTDTGFGMDSEVRNRIFEPFFTTKEEGKGTGLGLSMVYGVIKNHGGCISVYSEPGHGSTFKAYLPMSDKAKIRAAPTKETPYGKGELVLVVDDEEHMRGLAKDILESHNYGVVVAQDGAEALEVFGKYDGAIELVILDLVMPRMGGHETFLRMNAQSPGVKVLLSTGYSQNGKAQEILNSGVMGFIQKPYHPTELLSKVRSVLERESRP